ALPISGKRGGPGFSLSPGSLRALSPGERLVLPSPNGATLSMLASEAGAVVLAGCLRNAAVVAQAARALGDSVTVIAAGEQWRYDRPSLRPSLEDAIGAGAIVAALAPLSPSPEAEAALATFRNAQPRLLETLAACSSGREL